MIRKVMEVIHQSVGGLDVHKKMVTACRRRLLGDGQVESEVLEFRTTTLGLSELSKGNIKLSSVATDVMGVSGRAMILAMIEGEEDAERLASLAKGRLKSKREQWVESLEGRLNDDDRWVMKELWEQMEYPEEEIARYDEQIKEKMSPYEESLKRLMTIDLIERRSAENILAEIGPDMRFFPSDDNLVSWAGLCPGSEESAKKNRSGKTPKGNQWLRRALVEPAWGAARRKDGYPGAMYRGIAVRRGEKRAVVAVARTILQAAWHVLSKGEEYKERGGDYFDRINSEQTKNKLIRRLERLGYEVELKAKQAAV